MDKIDLNTLSLVTFDKDIKEHILFLKKILNDNTVIDRFNGFLSRLNARTNGSLIGKGFFVSDNSELVGYIDIGDYNKDEEAVYLRGLIDKDQRGKKYGSRMLSETSEYLFNHYPEIKRIMLKIAQDNIASLKTASACNFKWFVDDYYALDNPYVKSNQKL